MDKKKNEINELDILNGIGRVITSSLELDTIFENIMEIIGSYFNPRNWSLLLAEEETERLYFKLVKGVDSNKLKDVYLVPGEGIAGWVYKNKHFVIINDPENDARFSKKVDDILGFTTSSIIAVPIVNGKNMPIGVIELINKIHKSSGIPEKFTENDMKILNTIASFTGIAIENAFLYEKIKKLAHIDPLSGIYNRHYFNETLEKEIELAKKHGYSVCVIMMDIDGFKQINDTQGHLVGDKAISESAKLLEKCIRPSDTLARFGGDEFVIFMPNATIEDGKAVTEKIQNNIEEWNNNPTIPNVALSLSCGVYASDLNHADELIKKADEDLYICKKAKKKKGICHIR